ncbi:MAG: histone deacetylase [Thermoanaerobaculia bacterium]|nr:histone deacetylase [Thermoanaerobaculia bacterium]
MTDEPAGGLRRAFGRLAGKLRRLTGPAARVIFADSYVFHSRPTPLDPSRAENLLAFLDSEGLVRPQAVRRPRTASMAQLLRVHDPEYLENLREPGVIGRIAGSPLATAEEDRFFEIQRAMTGGTLLATREALRMRGFGINLGGGFHHAHADKGSGFCLVNDVAVAIRSARLHGFRDPILVIDLDLHDGDGTRRIFADDATVHTFSIHNHTWDDHPAIEATVLPLGSGFDDATYLAALEHHLPPLVRRFQPGLVFYLAGTDPARTDEIGDAKITSAGMLARDRFVIETLREETGGVPTVIVLAGGYGPNSWRYSARFLAWLLSGVAVEPPSTWGVTLDRFRSRARLLSPGDLGQEAAEGDGFGLTEADLVGSLDRSSVESRFLGYYSRHGLELALERLGLLPTLRARGFLHPVLEIDSGNPTGQTLRLTNDCGPDGPRELLAELRARRDRGAVPGLELLRAEWLLLQNPRESFPPNRPRLPGQEHPGLGLLVEVVAILVLMCERLELDGVLFVPAHYHLVSQGLRHLAFLDPVDAARFAAYREALAGLPLAQATHAAENGQVVDTKTGQPALWRPVPMVIPVSQRLRERLAGAEYQAARDAARAGFGFRLA